MLNALLEAWRRELSQALEMMTGHAYPVSSGRLSSGAPGSLLWYAQRFSGAGVFSVGAEEHVWNELGTRALRGAGIDLIERDEARSTWFEMVQQSISGAARAVSREGSALELSEGGAADGPPKTDRFFSATITTPEGLELDVHVAMVLPPEFANPSAARPAAAAQSSREQPERRGATDAAMDVLRDVHLPVSISFGHTQLRLKDVLKLTTGSVVELNRQPEEPVDVIVNDYVIARGEVVIVDGNYAVRIQEIVSRQQRLGLRDAGVDPTRKSV